MRASTLAAALVAVLVGFGGTLALVVGAARAVGAGPENLASWVWALCVGIGISSLVLSWRHRIPMVTAWSLAGAVLIGGLPPGTGMDAATGAFLLSALLMLLAGLVPALGALVARLPAPLGAAMLAGLLLRFVTGLFQAGVAEPALVLPLLVLFLVWRELHPASAPLGVLAAGAGLAWVLGDGLPAPSLGLAWPHWVTPRFDPATLVGLGLPLFLVTMATQQIPGSAVLRAAGYTPPAASALTVTGAVTLVLAPFGGYSVNLSSLVMAICTSPDAHPDRAQRWRAGVAYGVLYLLLAPFGAGFAAMVAGLPPSLVAAVAGAALMGPMVNALAVAMAAPAHRFAATVAFGVTASGIGALGVGSAFWGLVAGLVVLGVERVRG